MLHLISQSPIEAAVLDRIETGDSIVFLENAVLRLLQQGDLKETLDRLKSHCRLYVLSDELAVRGIRADELINGIEVIDYTGFVDLTVVHELIQTWR